MSDKLQIADDVRRLAQGFRGILELADELEAIGTIEQVTADVQARLDRANNALSDVRVTIDAARKEHDAVLERITADRLAAEQAVKALQADAKIKATGKVAAAEVKAREIVEGANAYASNEIEAANKAAASIKDAAELAAAELSALNTDIAEKKEYLDALNAHVAEVKSKIAAI